MHFYCPRPCNDLAAKFLNNFMRMDVRIGKLEGTVSDIDSRIGTLEASGMDKRVEKLEAQMEQMSEPQAGSSIESAALIKNIADEQARKQVAEMEDRARRRSNLVIFRLEEDPSTDQSKSKDMELVQTILAETKSPHQPTNIRRLGNPKAQEEGVKKTRPLRLTFATDAARDETITSFRKATKDITEDDPRLISKIAIRKDMTPSERQEEQALFLEWKERKAQSLQENDTQAIWIRRKGKVVNIGKYPPVQTDSEEEALKER